MVPQSSMACVISIKIAGKSTSLSLWLSGFLQNLYEMSHLMKVTKEMLHTAQC